MSVGELLLRLSDDWKLSCWLYVGNVLIVRMSAVHLVIMHFTVVDGVLFVVI